MAPVPKKSVEHFTHPSHRLVLLDADNKYFCDGCKTIGLGRRYRCHGCDFDLHEYCGTCPRSLSSFMHPHTLSLVIRKAQGTRQNDRICDVCSDPVEGLFYRCKDCEFDVHPLCTQLPQHLRHVLHPVHPLTLQTSSSSWCAVCRGACPSWRYRCGVCGFDIHLECVLTPCVPPTQRTPPPPPPPPHYAAYTPNPYMYNCVNQAQSGGAANRRSGKMMYSLAEKLAIGVISNMIFGMPNMDFSSFV